MGRGTKQKPLIAVVAFGLAMTLAYPASCLVDCRSLEWGVQEGTRVDYTRVGYSETGSFAWRFYVVVGPVPVVPDYLVDWTELTGPILGLFWLNGTETVPYYVYGGSFMLYSVLPIGNWTLIADLIEYQETVNVTESYNYWGFSYTIRGGSYERRNQVDFLKRDGMLAHLNFEVWNTTSSTKTRESSTTRVGLPIDLPFAPIILDNLAYIGAGVAVLVVAFIVLRRRRIASPAA